jgi:WD40 repeat protein
MEQHARHEADRQAAIAQSSERAATEQRSRTQSLLEETKLDRAEDLFMAGNCPAALAKLAQVLRSNPNSRVAPLRAISALTWRNFSLPTTQALNHADGVKNARFSPNGELVATASRDKSACVWNVGSGRKLFGSLVHGGQVNTVEFSSDGKRLLTASFDQTARIWDITSLAPLTTIQWWNPPVLVPMAEDC